MSEKLKIKIPVETAKEIKWGDSGDFTVVDDLEMGSSRWANDYRLIVQRKSDGLFFEAGYRMGTGDEGERPWEYETDDVELTQVFPREVTTTIYE